MSAKHIIAISNHGIMLGGGEHSFLELLSHLPETWQTTAIVPEQGELSDRLRKKGIETRVIPLPSIRPWLITHIIASLGTCASICRKYCASVIYANGSRAAFYGGIVGKILKIPVVWHCRITKPDFFPDFLLSVLCNMIAVNSRATAKRFSPNVQSKVRLVYNGIDIKWLQENAGHPDSVQKEWKIILVMARISKDKRHDLALETFEKVAESDENVHLICVGAWDSSEPEWTEQLLGRTKSSAASDRIHWIGQTDDVRPWYQVAHMLIHPSENESFGRVLAEAMACGTPVIATRTGGIPELVRHEKDGILVTPGDVEEMAEAVVKILKNNSLRRRFAKSARERAESFSLEAHVHKMIQIFDELEGS